tara:strand:+ start:182 stop:1129 length:948 start_codon:yes stop_codon:yes gene_type:complete
MPELNNTEFDLNVRIQKQLHDNTHEKVKNHQALNDDEIKYLCPVAFKRRMVKSEIAKLGLSKHYSFVPTMKVVDDLRALGYEVVDAKQVKARKKSTDGYQKHMITFEHPDYKVDKVKEVEIADGVTETVVEPTTEYPQILLTNSHDGGNAFTLSAGIFRLVCSNGLVIKSEDYGSSRLVHKGYSFEAVQQLVQEFEGTISEVLTKITAMKRKQLTDAQMLQFAKQAALLRFKAASYNENNIADVVDIDEILEATRPEDAGNGLYEVYNRVQESLINGNYHYKLGTKHRKGRTIKSFKQNIDVNKKLSELAFELAA